MPDTFVRNVPKEQALAAAEAAYMPKGMVTVPFNPMLVNTGSKLVLIDTGFGPARRTSRSACCRPTWRPPASTPRRSTSSSSRTCIPTTSTASRRADGSLAFPNAEIMVPAVDWAFWMSDDNMSQGAQRHDEGLLRQHAQGVCRGIADKVTKYEWGKEVAPGITAIDAHGHTPGHTAFAVASGNGKVLVQSDVTNIPELFLRNPDWHVAFDIDPEQAVATRRKFYDMAAAEKALIAGFHFSFPSHRARREGRHRLSPGADRAGIRRSERWLSDPRPTIWTALSRAATRCAPSPAA